MKVSVIVPTYNAEGFIALCLDALITQNFTPFEIIVVDNGSHDKTCEIIKRYSTVRLLYQNDIQSSYAARNIGITQAKGDILAFTDADCIPEKDWLENAINHFKEKNIDMLGGKIEFMYSSPPTGAEILDSLLNMQNKENVLKKNSSVTANFFIKGGIFNLLGGFPEVISGGDIRFSRKATLKGYKLFYAENVIVKHPARKLGELLSKSWRTGSGTILARDYKNKINTLLNLLMIFILFLIVPPNPLKWKKKASIVTGSNNLILISIVSSHYLVRLTSSASSITTYLIHTHNRFLQSK